MKNYFLGFVISIMLSGFPSLAQETTWGSKIDYQFGIRNDDDALGKPDQNACQTKNTQIVATLEVLFYNLIEAKKVIVYEALNPGSIVKIVVWNTDGKKFEIYKKKQLGEGTDSKEIIIRTYRFPAEVYGKIKKVQLNIDTYKFAGIYAIDAVGLSTEP